MRVGLTQLDAEQYLRHADPQCHAERPLCISVGILRSAQNDKRGAQNDVFVVMLNANPIVMLSASEASRS